MWSGPVQKWDRARQEHKTFHSLFLSTHPNVARVFTLLSTSTISQHVSHPQGQASPQSSSSFVLIWKKWMLTLHLLQAVSWCPCQCSRPKLSHGRWGHWQSPSFPIAKSVTICHHQCSGLRRRPSKYPRKLSRLITASLLDEVFDYEALDTFDWATPWTWCLRWPDANAWYHVETADTIPGTRS